MGAAAGLVIWSHALAALLFGALAAWTLRLDAKRMPRIPFAVALIATALWALAVAGIGEAGGAAHLTAGLRDLAWLAVLLLLHRTVRPENGFAPIGSVYGVIALVMIAGVALRLLADAAASAQVAESIVEVASALGLIAAISGLWLVQGLMTGAGRRRRWAIALAPAVLWGLDLLVLLGDHGFGQAEWAQGVRGATAALVAALLAIGLHRADQWNVRVSRTVALQSLSFVAAGLYLAAVAVGASLIAHLTGSRALQTVFVVGATATALGGFSSPHLRAFAKVKLAKHFYRHRYDYRAEWIRFTDTLGSTDASLEARAIRAIADLTESPAGTLLVPDGDGLAAGAHWGWQGDGGASDPSLAALLAGGRIVELDAARAGGDDAGVPRWMLDRADAWVIVPLPHHGALAGAVLLARPPIDRPLDWEDFDILRIAAHQVASHLAEARAREALIEARRFEEFNRRFAFILHDIKNLVSQISLVARNAERHADNPAFRADMVATLNDSAGRMNTLLARLSQHHRAGPESPTPVPLLALAGRVAAGRRAQHRVTVSGDRTATAIGEPARIEQILGHLLQNAIDASDPAQPVEIAVHDDGAAVAIDVIDRGCGMSAAFIRDRLFKPFDSTKPSGFGIGAFEARQLAEAMRGRIDVDSREGEGSRFRLTLPRAPADTDTDTNRMEQAA